MMAGGLAWPSGPCAPGTGSPARGYHRTLCIYCCYFFGGLIHAYSCSIMLPEGVETVLMPMAPMSDRHIGVRSCLTEVAKSGTHMHRFTALEAEARTEVFQAPAVISGDPWRTLGGPLGSVKMEKTWGKYFLKPPRMGVCVPRYPALLSGPRIVRAEGSEVKGGGRGGAGFIHHLGYGMYFGKPGTLECSSSTASFFWWGLLRSKKRGAPRFCFRSPCIWMQFHMLETKKMYFPAAGNPFRGVPEKTSQNPMSKLMQPSPATRQVRAGPGPITASPH